MYAQRRTHNVGRVRACLVISRWEKFGRARERVWRGKRKGWCQRQHKRGGRTERVTDRGEGEKEEDRSKLFFLAFLQLLIWSSGRQRSAKRLHPTSCSSLALVSFREIHCPPWAVYMPDRQPAQPGHVGEKKRNFSFLSLVLLSSFLLSCSPVSCRLAFSSVLLFSSSLPLTLKFLFLKSMFSLFQIFFFFHSSGELSVLQGQVQSSLAKLYSQPDSLQHSGGGGSVCYKTFRGARGWLRLGFLLCFAELLSSFSPPPLSHLLFPLSFSLDATPYSELWNGRVFFFPCVLQEEQLGAANKGGL